jgi:predicted CoA-binding protein
MSNTIRASLLCLAARRVVPTGALVGSIAVRCPNCLEMPMQVDAESKLDPIRALLRPRSIAIAIAGASAHAGKLGALLTFLRKYGYRGALFPINPNVSDIDGLPCYPNISAIEAPIDLLVVAMAAAKIPELLRACKPGQVKAVIVLSSGYAELGMMVSRRRTNCGGWPRARGSGSSARTRSAWQISGNAPSDRSARCSTSPICNRARLPSSPRAARRNSPTRRPSISTRSWPPAKAPW